MKRFKFMHSVFVSTYIFILLPMLVILPLSIVSTVYFKNFYYNILQNQYSSKLESLSNENEITLQSIAKNIHFLQNDDAFIRTFKGGSDDADVLHSISQITKIYENYPIIDSIAIVQRNSGKTYATDGRYENSDYFCRQYVYVLYNQKYWREYQAPYSEKRVLPPTKVKTKTAEKTIIPIVFARVGNEYSSNLIIVNVSLSNILSGLADKMEQDGTTAAVINRQTLEWFDNKDLTYRISDEFWEKIAPRGIATFKSDNMGSNALIVSYSPSNAVLLYTYAIAIPATVIFHQVRGLLYLLIAIWFGLFLVILLIAQFSAKTIYAPVKGLMETILPEQENEDKTISEFEVIKNYIQTARDTMITYLPIVQKRLLVEYLNGSAANYEEVKKRFADNGLVFAHEYFCVVILRLRPAEGYYMQYTNVQHESMMRKMLDVMCAIFPESYDTYSLPIKSDMLYVLLNVDETVQIEDIKSVTDKFACYLEPDKEIIHSKFAVGRYIRSKNMGFQ